jgi:hypothetical protein
MILPVQYLQMNLHFNTVRRWAKHQNDELQRIPKNRQKVHIWGAGCVDLSHILMQP